MLNKKMEATYWFLSIIELSNTMDQKYKKKDEQMVLLIFSKEYQNLVLSYASERFIELR